MAFGAATIADAGGAVKDLFGGFGDLAQSDLKASGMNLQAKGLRLKAQGDLAEASNYDLASGLAGKNIAFTQQSTAIKQMQNDRNIFMTMGSTRADVAGAGLAQSGSALDLLADSANQGRLIKSVTEQQGMITEESYREQQKSFDTLASAARMTAAGEFDIANQTDELADKTRDAGQIAAIGDFASGLMKGAAAFMTL